MNSTALSIGLDLLNEEVRYEAPGCKARNAASRRWTGNAFSLRNNEKAVEKPSTAKKTDSAFPCRYAAMLAGMVYEKAQVKTRSSAKKRGPLTCQIRFGNCWTIRGKSTVKPKFVRGPAGQSSLIARPFPTWRTSLIARRVPFVNWPDRRH